MERTGTSRSCPSRATVNPRFRHFSLGESSPGLRFPSNNTDHRMPATVSGCPNLPAIPPTASPSSDRGSLSVDPELPQLPPTTRTPWVGGSYRPVCTAFGAHREGLNHPADPTEESTQSRHLAAWRIDTYPMPTPFSSPACCWSRPRSDATTCLSVIRKRSCGAATRWPPAGAIVGTSLSLPIAALSAIAACQCIRQARLAVTGNDRQRVRPGRLRTVGPMCEAELVVVVFRCRAVVVGCPAERQLDLR
jgi:hypothetical protein